MEEQQYTCLEARLRKITGEDDLSGVRNLVLAVDTHTTQVDHLGTLMPLLTELRLERGSILASFRDLGSSLSHLRVLWLSACGILHLDGVGALLGLEELYLAFNDVEDLTSIALHDRLEVLDLESNNVGDSEQAIQLGTCSRLWSLNLTANPVCRERHYRRNIVEAVPQLASLDERDVTDDDRRPLSSWPGEDDCQRKRRSCRASSQMHRTPPQHHLAMISSGEVFPTTKAQQDCPMSRTLDCAGKVEHQEISGLRSEMESLDARSSAHLRCQVRDKSASPNIGTATKGGQQEAAVLCQTAEIYLPGSFERRVQLGGDGRNECGIEVLAARDVSEEGLHTYFSRYTSYVAAVSAQGEPGNTKGGGSREGDRIPFAGETEVDSPGSFAGCGKHFCVKNEGLDPECPVSSSTINAAHFVDEEEMVAKAIKNFRLLSETSSTGYSLRSNTQTDDVITSRRGLAEGGSPLGSSTRQKNTGKSGPRGTAGDIFHTRRSSMGAESSGTERWPPCGNNSDMDELTAQEGVESENRTEGREGHGNEEDKRLEAHDVWEGKDWLLEILSLPELRSAGTSSGSRLSLQAAENAASMLTHGSEVSFAGNPALGLRHRRRPYEIVNGLSRAISLKTQFQFEAVARTTWLAGVARQEWNEDGHQHPETVERRGRTWSLDPRPSNTSRLSEDSHAVETAPYSQETTDEGDGEMKLDEKEATDARGGEAYPISTGGAPAKLPGHVCVSSGAYACPSSCCTTTVGSGRLTEKHCSPGDVASSSSIATLSSSSPERVQQSCIRCMSSVGVEARKLFDHGNTEESVNVDPSDSSHQADTLRFNADLPTTMDYRRPINGADLMDGETRKSLQSKSATTFQASSIIGDIETPKMRRQRRQQSDETVEPYDAPPGWNCHDASNTGSTQTPLEVPEWSPTTTTDSKGDNQNVDANSGPFFACKGRKPRDPAVCNMRPKGSGQGGSSSREEPVVPNQSTEVVGQGSGNPCADAKYGEGDADITETPWLVDNAAWSNSLASLEQKAFRDEQLLRAEQRRSEHHSVEDRIGSVGPLPTVGCRRESAVIAFAKDDLRRRRYSKKNLLTLVTDMADLEGVECGVSGKGEEHGGPAVGGQRAWAGDGRLVPLPKEISKIVGQMALTRGSHRTWRGLGNL